LVAGRQTIDTAFWPPDVDNFRIAKPRRQLHKGIKYSLQIEWGAADDFEHLGCRSLLLQRLLSLAGKPLDLLLPRAQRMICESAQRLAQYDSCGLTSFDDAL
jgi:hypothetical protein